jgi:hypothetical protein
MSGIGVSGAYGTPVNGITGSEYPPAPGVWNAGLTWPLSTSPVGALNANDLNQQLSLPVGFLAQRPKTRLEQQSVQALAAGFNTITWDFCHADPWGLQSNASDLSQIVIPEAWGGWWLVQASLPVTPAAAGNTFTVGFSVNVSGEINEPGEAFPAQNTNVIIPGAVVLLNLAPGSTVQFACTASAAANTAQSNGQMPAAASLTARWIGVGTYPTAVPSIPDLALWTATQDITSAVFNSQIVDSVQFLTAPSITSGATFAAQAVASGTNVALANISATCPYQEWAEGSSTWTCKIPGVYLVSAVAQLGGTAASAYFANMGLTAVQSGTSNNYTSMRVYGTGSMGPMMMRRMRFAAGDTFTPYIFQNSGSTVNTLAAAVTVLWESA